MDCGDCSNKRKPGLLSHWQLFSCFKYILICLFKMLVVGDLTDLVHSLPFIILWKSLLTYTRQCTVIIIPYTYCTGTYRFFFIMYRSLQKLFQDADSWDLHLDSALFGIRQDISHTTKYSPLQIAYGRPHEMKLKEMETPKEATEDMLKIWSTGKHYTTWLRKTSRMPRRKWKKIMEERLLPKICLHLGTLCIGGIAGNCKGNSQSWKNC